MNQENKNVQKQNRKTMILIFTIFLAPVLFAYLAYFGGWFAGAAKNKGELLAHPGHLEDYVWVNSGEQPISGAEFETYWWWLIPISSEQCGQICQLNLYMLEQTHIGLGKEQERVKRLLVLDENGLIKIDKLTVEKIKDFPIAYTNYHNHQIQLGENKRSKQPYPLDANYIYLADPLGNIILRYPLINKSEEAIDMSKALRTDMLRLLKYSRLG